MFFTGAAAFPQNAKRARTSLHWSAPRPLPGARFPRAGPKPIFLWKGPTTVPELNPTMAAQKLARGPRNFFYIFFTS